MIAEPIPPVFDPAFPDQNVKTQRVYGPDGAVLRSIEPDGKITHTCVDGLGRTVKTVTNPSVANPCDEYTLSADSAGDITNQSVYDIEGNRVLARDPNGKEIHYTYDAAGRLVDEEDALENHITYQYDALGNRVATTNAKGIATRFEYDAAGRLTAVVENYRSGENGDQRAQRTHGIHL